MLKHRSKKISRTRLCALCVLISCGFALSCEDDYIYNDSEPSWLGSSIYGFLNDAGNYTNYVRIIDDLNYSEVLSRTGSKTLFVADDSAFNEFFAENKWNVGKYEDLTLAQKKIILYSSMLDNAYLLNMMSSLAGNPPLEGSCLRQTSSASVYDSIPFVTGSDIPQNNKHWDRFRATGIRLAIDGTDPMMLHFLKEYLQTKNITDEDFSYLFYKNGTFAKTRSGDEGFIFGSKILNSGIAYDEFSDDTLTITCKNGYVYRMDGVLVPPSNMAEEIRNNPKTKLFSRMIERFSYPLYSPALSNEYNRLYHSGDDAASERVYEKRYFSSQTNHTNSSFVDDDGKSQSAVASLTFDPGWNQYAASAQTSKEEDMGVIFVPNDDVLTGYFSEGGGGYFLVERYGAPHYGEDWPLERSLDSIPINIIQAFLTNLMKTSFASSVPSKFDKITNDARDPMGVTTAHIDECLIANNGIVYILNTVFGPAKYVAVSAPPLVQENMRIINFAITSTSFLLNYNSYLLAMDSYFSLVVPGDDYFKYYDPVTLEKDDKIMYTFHFGRPTASASKDIVWAKKSKYDPLTYEEGDSMGVITYTSQDDLIENRLHDLMEYFIVVGDFDDGNQYYLTKGYGSIKVKNSGSGVTQIYGGEQLENGKQVNVLTIYDQTVAGNGKTYLTDGLPTPPTKSVYSIMSTTPEYSEFFELCNIQVDSIVYAAFPLASKTWNDSIAKYSVFYKQPKSNNGRDYNVSFFSTYHYTVYVPTNDAMERAYAAGLPRPDFWRELANDTVNDVTLQLAAYLRMVNKFVRYHFQDNSVFVDNLPFSVTEAGAVKYVVDYETAALNENTGRFYNLTLETKDETLSVTDQMGNLRKVKNDAGTEGTLYNVMARDMTFNNKDPKAASSISTSSFATIQSVDGILLNDGVGYKGSDGAWHYNAYDKDGNLLKE